MAVSPPAKEFNQYDVYLVNLDPTIGHEIKKSRPCAVISPNEMNRYIQTVIIAPMTTKSHDYPSRARCNFDKKDAWVVVDKIRTVDKIRLIKKLGSLDKETIKKIKGIIKEMLVD
jgi:mRNA interferase MazF